LSYTLVAIFHSGQWFFSMTFLHSSLDPFNPPFNPLMLSQQLLSLLGTQVSLHYQERIPQQSALIVVSNHRSFMDAPLLMSAIARPIHFACHHYMGQLPLMREFVSQLGALPLDPPQQRYQTFLHQASQLLRRQQVIGIFPEGTGPMVQETSPQSMGEFQRGFAHLALRIPVKNLAILPLAIASHQEVNTALFPVRLLHWLDPSEPLFNQSGWHPFVAYQNVSVRIGQPIWITSTQQQDYHGKLARQRVVELTNQCHQVIRDLLNESSTKPDPRPTAQDHGLNRR
jgi:1-acyl-sn-glycerol-3-phosphate acyltransferase